MLKLLPGLSLILLLITPWERAARLAEEGDLEGAEREYRTLMATDSLNPELRYNLGTVLLMAGRFDEARPHLEFAAAGLPADGRTAYNIGNTDLEPAFADSTL